MDPAPLLLFVALLVALGWVLAYLPNSRGGWRALASFLFWGGTAFWLLEVAYVPRWGIRLYDAMNGSGVVYGWSARLLLLVATGLVFANIALAHWVVARRA